MLALPTPPRSLLYNLYTPRSVRTQSLIASKLALNLLASLYQVPLYVYNEACILTSL